MPRRHHPDDMPFNTLLGSGFGLQTAPRRDVPFFTLPAISEGSISGGSSSSTEYAVGQMELDEEDRARWKQNHRVHHSRVHDGHSRGRSRSESRNDSFKRCERCSLWINMKDRGLHAKACATMGTSPVNVSRDSDYHHGPLASAGRPPPHASAGADDGTFPPRGRTGRPAYHTHPHAPRSRSRSRTATDSTFRPRAHAHPESSYRSPNPALAVPQSPSYLSSPPSYMAYDAAPPAWYFSQVPSASSLPVYPASGYQPGSRTPPIPISPTGSHPLKPFAPLENDPYRSRYYRR